MATSGSATSNVISNGKIHLQISWSQASQDITGNYTKINWNVRIYSDGSGWNIQTSTNRTLKVVINGSTVYNGGVNVSINSGASKTLASGSATIYHNADGTKSFSFSAAQSFSGISFSGATIYASVVASSSSTLNTIPRVSSFDSFSFTFTPTEAKLQFDITAGSTAFNHKLQVDLNTSGTSYNYLIEQSGYKVSTANKKTRFTYTFTEAQRTRLLNHMANTNTVRLRTFLTTYNGSTQLGWKESWCNATINTSTVLPVFTDFSYSDPDHYALMLGSVPKNNLVQRKSNLKIDISSTQKAVAQYGATMSKYIVTFGNTSKEYAYGNGTQSISFGIAQQSGNINLSIQAVDSRGNKTTVTKTVAVTAYDYPKSNSTVARVNNYERETMISVAGTYTAVGENVPTAFYRYSEQSGGGEWDSIPIRFSNGNFSYDPITVICDNSKTFYFEIKIQDLLTEIVIPYIIYPGETPITFYEDGSIDIKGEYLQNGTPYFSKENKVLWSGGWFMNENQTVTLNESVSDQQNGIVLVWREYNNGTMQNSGIHCYYVPKRVVADGPWGHSISWAHYGGTTYAAKYVYIRDTQIVGHEMNENTVTSDCGIKISNNRFVLWMVLGV